MTEIASKCDGQSAWPQRQTDESSIGLFAEPRFLQFIWFIDGFGEPVELIAIFYWLLLFKAIKAISPY